MRRGRVIRYTTIFVVGFWLGVAVAIWLLAADSTGWPKYRLNDNGQVQPHEIVAYQKPCFQYTGDYHGQLYAGSCRQTNHIPESNSLGLMLVGAYGLWLMARRNP